MVVRCASSDATLTSLTTSLGDLAPPFAPSALAYTLGPVRVGVVFPPPATLTVTATTTDPLATVAIAGTPTPSGQASAPIAIGAGVTPIDVVVTASDGVTTARYVVAVVGTPCDYLKASNTAGGKTAYAGPFFGAAVALSGDTLAVGAYGEASASTGVNGDESVDPNGGTVPAYGAVYVFVRSGGAWTQQAYVKASNTRKGAYFGYSVALSGDTLVVGSPNESSAATGIDGNQADTSSANAGAVYVFTRSGTTWTQQAYVKASNTPQTSTGVLFGFSVAIDGDTMAASSLHEASSATGVNGDQTSTSAFASGAVYVFTRAGATWTQQAYIKASNTRAPAEFGTSVALSGDTLAVGSARENSPGVGVDGDQGDGGPSSLSYAGAVYVFTRSGTDWSQQAYLKASNTAAGANFGISVALSKDTLAVGANGESSKATGVNDLADQEDTSAPNAGAVYVFARAGTAWSQQAYLKASNARAQSYFGYAVGLSGDTLAVGAPFESSGGTGVGADAGDMSASMAGAVYSFARSGATWSQTSYVKATNARAGARFGWSVATGPSALVVGSSEESSAATGVDGDAGDTSATNAGAVYVY